MSDKRYFDKSVLVTALKLAAILAAVTLMLAAVNAVTKDRIAANEAAEGAAARQQLVPDAAFESVAADALPSDARGTVEAVWGAYDASGALTAYCVDVTAMGFASDGIGMVVAVLPDGSLLSARVTNHAETSNIGSKATDRVNETGQVEAVSGATITSRGLENGVRLAQEAVTALKGGAQ